MSAAPDILVRRGYEPPPKAKPVPMYLPKRKPPKAAPKIVSPAEHRIEQQRKAHSARQKEYSGRNVGKPHGTFVTDEAERKMCVILCPACAPKFDPAKYHYYHTREFNIQGRCDACKEHAPRANLFIYEGLLGRKSGQCWWPR